MQRGRGLPSVYVASDDPDDDGYDAKAKKGVGRKVMILVVLVLVCWTGCVAAAGLDARAAASKRDAERRAENAEAARLES